MDLDQILLQIGDFGKYQKRVIWFILLPSVFPCGFHAYNQLFMATKSNYWCKIPTIQKLDSEILKNVSIPLELVDGKWEYSKCLMYDVNYTTVALQQQNFDFSSLKTIPCKFGWTYDQLSYKNSVITEWNLVCDKDFYATLALVFLGISGLIGNYIFGYVQDGLGRKLSFYIYLLIQTVFGVTTAFATNYYMWCIFRIGVGFTVPAILATPCVLAIELVGPRYRTAVTIFINISYSIALISLSIIVWLIRDWRLMAITTTLPFLLLFCVYKFFPESPRWLLSRGKFTELERSLKKIARTNKTKYQDSFILLLQENYKNEKLRTKRVKYYGFSDLFKNNNLRMKTIIITFIWFTNTSVYVGLSYYAPALGGDEFFNFFLASVVELPTYLFLWPSMERWGRRWILCVSMVVGGSACLATFLVENNSVLTLSFYSIGKMGISSSFVVLPLMASELYPTVVRGLGMSFSSVIGMLGPVFIPLINYLGSDMLTLPLIIMGSLLVAGGASSLLLPETLNQHLPQTLEDGEIVGLNYFRGFTCSRKSTKSVVTNEITSEF